jgi:tellurite resistance protein TehA-like permease
MPYIAVQARTRPQSLLAHAKNWVEQLPPASFALVMATGIVSIAAELFGFRWLAVALFVINLLAFAVLSVMTLARFMLFTPVVMRDLRMHARGAGYFTIVAGICVIGVQLCLLGHAPGAAGILWLLAIVLWLCITYGFFTAVIVNQIKPSLAEGLGGVWLIASVATQSIAVLGTTIVSVSGQTDPAVLFFCLFFHLMGCMLYFNVIALIFYRLTFLPIMAESITPPFWINMGATAIATQAGANLVLLGPQSPLLTELIPFVKGFTLFFWAAGSWWIPLLVCLTLWVHWRKQRPLVYTPLLWAAVFPLGMYTVSTYQLGQALELNGLLLIPAVTVYVALIAWGLTFFGLLRRLMRAIDDALQIPSGPRPS